MRNSGSLVTRAVSLSSVRSVIGLAWGVAYDEDLADRIRELVGDERGVSEKRMFGGLAFLVNGNMAVSASGQGGLLVRIDPAQTDRLVTRAHVERFEDARTAHERLVARRHPRASHEAPARAVGGAGRGRYAEVAPAQALN